MSRINGSLQIGQSAIMANQAALQIIGNNIANASDPNYARQRPVLAPVSGGQVIPGVSSGMGVGLSNIERLVDEAINARLRKATSDRSSAETASNQLGQIKRVGRETGCYDARGRRMLAREQIGSACFSAIG